VRNDITTGDVDQLCAAAVVATGDADGRSFSGDQLDVGDLRVVSKPRNCDRAYPRASTGGELADAHLVIKRCRAVALDHTNSKHLMSPESTGVYRLSMGTLHGGSQPAQAVAPALGQHPAPATSAARSGVSQGSDRNQSGSRAYELLFCPPIGLEPITLRLTVRGHGVRGRPPPYGHAGQRRMRSSAYGCGRQ